MEKCGRKTAMTGTDQDRFLAAVRKALGIASPRQAPPGLFETEPSEKSRRLLEQIRQRGADGIKRLLVRLEQAAEPLNMELYTAASLPAAANLISRIASKKSPEWGNQKQVAAWRHPLIDRLNLETVLDAPLFVARPDPALAPEEGRRQLRRRVAESFIGVTAADFCLADTATLVLRTRPGQARCVSLLPSIHVAVIESGRLLADLAELYALLRWDSPRETGSLFTSMVLISGPSKTADIEATLVHGAHGPRELHLIVVSGGKTLDSGSEN
jgi:L-lactate dehydrogenase complex protein LldG